MSAMYKCWLGGSIRLFAFSVNTLQETYHFYVVMLYVVATLLLCLPAFYLCEWDVISASTMWTHVHFNWQQCLHGFLAVQTALRPIIWLNFRQIFSHPIGGLPIPQLELSFNLLANYGWAPCYTHRPTVWMRLLFLALYLTLLEETS